MSLPDAAQTAGALLGALASLWVAVRWLLFPRLRLIIRSALEPELSLVAGLEAERLARGDRLDDLEARVNRAEAAVRDQDLLRLEVKQLTLAVERSNTLQQQSVQQLSSLAGEVGELRGALDVVRERRT